MQELQSAEMRKNGQFGNWHSLIIQSRDNIGLQDDIQETKIAIQEGPSAVGAGGQRSPQLCQTALNLEHRGTWPVLPQHVLQVTERSEIASTFLHCSGLGQGLEILSNTLSDIS